MHVDLRHHERVGDLVTTDDRVQAKPPQHDRRRVDEARARLEDLRLLVAPLQLREVKNFLLCLCRRCCGGSRLLNRLRPIRHDDRLREVDQSEQVIAEEGHAGGTRESVPEHAHLGLSVLEDFSPPFAGYYLYYPKRQHASPALRALVDHLRSSRPQNRSTPRRRHR